MKISKIFKIIGGIVAVATLCDVKLNPEFEKQVDALAEFATPNMLNDMKDGAMWMAEHYAKGDAESQAAWCASVTTTPTAGTFSP